MRRKGTRSRYSKSGLGLLKSFPKKKKKNFESRMLRTKSTIVTSEISYCLVIQNKLIDKMDANYVKDLIKTDFGLTQVRLKRIVQYVLSDAEIMAKVNRVLDEEDKKVELAKNIVLPEGVTLKKERISDPDVIEALNCIPACSVQNAMSSDYKTDVSSSNVTKLKKGDSHEVEDTVCEIQLKKVSTTEKSSHKRKKSSKDASIVKFFKDGSHQNKMIGSEVGDKSSQHRPLVNDRASKVPPKICKLTNGANAEKLPWSRDEDRRLLIDCQKFGATEAVFAMVSKSLKTRTLEEVQSRFCELEAILTKSLKKEST